MIILLSFLKLQNSSCVTGVLGFYERKGIYGNPFFVRRIVMVASFLLIRGANI